MDYAASQVCEGDYPALRGGRGFLEKRGLTSLSSLTVKLSRSVTSVHNNIFMMTGFLHFDFSKNKNGIIFFRRIKEYVLQREREEKKKIQEIKEKEEIKSKLKDQLHASLLSKQVHRCC